MRTKTAVVTTVALLTLLSGCGDGAGETAEGPAVSESTSEESTEEATEEPAEPESSEPEPSEPAEEVVLTIEEFRYSDLEPVAPGTEITVENTDAQAHTVTADGEGDFDVTIPPGESGTFTAPEEAGEYPYLCTFHAGMTATLRVE